MSAVSPPIRIGESRITPILHEKLQAFFGQRYKVTAAVREQHGRDESPYDPIPPDAVIFAESTADVQTVMNLAREHRVPLIPFGAGSSLEGQLLAVAGGISLDLSRMNRIVEIDVENHLAVLEAGAARASLNEATRTCGLFFPIDPGADATFGGMCATRASGTNAVRYGTMRDNVLGLSVVTPMGEVIHTGSRARKSSSGYDLTRLFVGSEGTLGVITEVIVRLHPVPACMDAASCHFPNVEKAVRAAARIIQLGIPIARCELLDRMSIVAINRHSKLALPELPMLLMEFHGSRQAIDEQTELVLELVTEEQGEGFQWASTPEDRTKLWKARHNAFFATLQLKPGARAVTTDVCVPISKLADCIIAAEAEVLRAGLPATILGHVGDGNYHVAMLVDPKQPEERDLAERVNERLVRHALDCGGTCTGEHGIGLHKMRFFAEEHDAGSITLMRLIKGAIDPMNILNPGKIFDEDD